MTGSSEFSTWMALAGAAIVAGLCAIYSSSLWVLIPGALLGAYGGYKASRSVDIMSSGSWLETVPGKDAAQEKSSSVRFN